MAKKIIHPEPHVEFFVKGMAPFNGKGAVSHGEPLPLEKAKELIGWEEEPEGETWERGTYLFTFKGVKVRLNNRPTNRPFRRSLADRWKSEFLRNKWEFNGEPIIIDRLGHVQDAQHRLAGFIMAVVEYKHHPGKWKEDYGTKAIRFECQITYGISEKPEVVDTLNTGQKRTLADVIFRRQEFGKKITEKDAQRLATVLAQACRLVWLRTTGKKITDAPHFPHSEAIDFVTRHPKLVDAVEFIVNEDRGEKGAAKRISGVEGGLSLGSAAGMMYLAGMAATDPDAFREAEEPTEVLDDSMWDQASDFWVKFASYNCREGLPEDTANDPILSLVKSVGKVDAGGALGRDAICGMIAKAYTAYVEGEPLTVRQVKIGITTTEDGKKELKEFPYIGGVDSEPPEEFITASEGWAIDDTTWVNDGTNNPWFGVITGFVDLDTAKVQVSTGKGYEDEGEEYPVALECLCVDEPEPEDDEEESEEAEEAAEE